MSTPDSFPPESLPREHASLLIIDDDPALLQALSDMLHFRLPGLTVVTCNDPVAALEEVHQRHYEVILCDLSMPKRHGLDLLPELRQAAPEATVIIMSGIGDETLRHTVTRLGGTAFLPKPFDRDTVCRLVSRSLISRPAHPSART